MASIRIRNKVSSGGIPSGLTKGELAVNLADGVLWVGGTTDTPIYISGVQTFNGLTGHVGGVCAAQPNVFTALQTFTDGISAAGGVTFHDDVYVGGGLTVNGPMTVGGQLEVFNGISFTGEIYQNGYARYTIQTVGTTSDLRTIPGVTVGDVVWVNGPEGWDGLYVLRRNADPDATYPELWVRLNGGQPADLNTDGIVDGADLAFLLAAWGNTQETFEWAGQPLQIGIADGGTASFEVKVYGITTGKKASALRITSNEAEPYIEMRASETFFNSRVVVSDSSGEPAFRVQTGRSVFSEGVSFEARTQFDDLITANAGISAGCGVTFNCLTNFTKGLSASGATLGTLVVNGGATFNGPVYMGVTLTMNSNIRFNSGYGITGGFVDAGWY